MQHDTRLAVLIIMGFAVAAQADPAASIRAAQAFRAKGEAVQPAPDGTIFCEAEEFQVAKPGWVARPWGENYYAATFANTFLSRKAFLGAPEKCDETVASINVIVKEAGRYLVLVRYEAAYRFETQFKVKVEQGGAAKLDRLYGARANLKVWAFSEKLKPEVAWNWGAVENVVWEGHDAYADLQPGPAKITLIAGPQPEPQARRNVDLIMLTKDEAQVQERIAKEGYLPLDGWLTQAGDVHIRVSNAGAAAVKVTVDKVQEHSPYWVHMRKWVPVSVDAEPGKTTDWVDVGGTMDSLNDGQWGVKSTGPCKVEYGVRNAAGQVEPVRTFDVNGSLALVSYADARYSRSIQTPQEANGELVKYLQAIPVHGKPPTRMRVYASSAIMGSLQGLYGLDGQNVQGPKAYTDLRSKGPAQLDAAAQALSPDARNNMYVVSLGDEIGLPAPPAGANDGFVAFLKAQGVAPKQVDPAAGDDWAKVTYSADPKLKDSVPGTYYWSMRYLYTYGIQAQKGLTDALRKHLPNAHIGANFSPHHGGYVHTFLGEVFKWVSCFRQDGMTLPWAEDYIWQVPVGTPQMNGINLDLFRAGNRGKPEREIFYYVMPHAPGNIPSMWRRLFYNAVAHGMTIMSLFEFDPVWTAYTENHVTGNEMYGAVLKSIRELGLFDDIVMDGQRRPAEVGLWFSETGDIWHDNEQSFAAGKRGLYVAILGTQHPLDVVVEPDALDGTLKGYKVLYLTDNHVSEAASAKIVDWVKAGGRLFATAGAGMFNEYNQPNKALRELMGVEQSELVAPKEAHVGFIKQDLPFVKPLGEVTWKVRDDSAPVVFPAFGLFSKIKAAGDAAVHGTFKDGAPAVVTRTAGKGGTVYCAFLPALSYFKPAIPLKPLDRGSTPDAMAHFVPTSFDAGAAALIASGVEGIVRPVDVSAGQIEPGVIESKAGTLVVLQNWGSGPVSGVRVTANIPVPKNATLASGGKLEVQKDGDRPVFVFDLDVADAIILR